MAVEPTIQQRVNKEKIVMFKPKPVVPTNQKTEKPKTPFQSANAFIMASREFEKSRIDELETSKKLAWKITIASTVLTFMSLGAVVGLTPLKTTEPYLVKVDNNTGLTTIVHTLSDAKQQYGEATARYFLGMFVRLHEGYEWESVQDTVAAAILMSGPKVTQELNDQYKRPTANHKILGQNKKINIKINSITFLNDIAQVRYTKEIIAANGGTFDAASGLIAPAPEKSNFIATIGYEYLNPPLSEQDRLINPLGFTVQSYRIDPDASIN